MNTETANGTQMTLDGFTAETYRKQTAGVLGSPARTSALPESRKVLKEAVQACFSELCNLSDNSKKKINPMCCSLKTLKIFLALTEDLILRDFSFAWMKTGMTRNGKFLIQKSSECPTTGRGCSLSDILEEETEEKYFLSEEQKNRIVLYK